MAGPPHPALQQLDLSDDGVNMTTTRANSKRSGKYKESSQIGEVPPASQPVNYGKRKGRKRSQEPEKLVASRGPSLIQVVETVQSTDPNSVHTFQNVILTISPKKVAMSEGLARPGPTSIRPLTFHMPEATGTVRNEEGSSAMPLIESQDSTNSKLPIIIGWMTEMARICNGNKTILHPEVSQLGL